MDRRTFIGTSLAAAGAVSVPGVATRGSAAERQSVENRPVILECAINGGTTKATNPLAPGTPAEHTAEVIQCLDAGASIIHMHSNQPNAKGKRLELEITKCSMHICRDQHGLSGHPYENASCIPDSPAHHNHAFYQNG